MTALERTVNHTPFKQVGVLLLLLWFITALCLSVLHLWLGPEKSAWSWMNTVALLYLIAWLGAGGSLWRDYAEMGAVLCAAALVFFALLIFAILILPATPSPLLSVPGWLLGLTVIGILSALGAMGLAAITASAALLAYL